MKWLPNEISYFFLVLLLNIELVPSQCPAQKIVLFDDIRPATKTPVFCAVTNAGVTQSNKKLTDCTTELTRCFVKHMTVPVDCSMKYIICCKKLTECSSDCAESDDCVGFNFKEPQLVCESFQTTFASLSLTPGCTYYQVSHDTCYMLALELSQSGLNKQVCGTC